MMIRLLTIFVFRYSFVLIYVLQVLHVKLELRSQNTSSDSRNTHNELKPEIKTNTDPSICIARFLTSKCKIGRALLGSIWKEVHSCQCFKETNMLHNYKQQWQCNKNVFIPDHQQGQCDCGNCAFIHFRAFIAIGEGLRTSLLTS